MKKKILYITIIYFAFLSALPGYMVWNRYDILKNGEAYKIEVTGYDPYDPFRGRYVAVSPKLNSFNSWYKTSYYLKKDGNGFVISVEQTDDKSGGEGFIKNFILDRYYMNEKLAHEAENSIIEALSRENTTVYVIVKVKNGSYVVDGLYINDAAIEEYNEIISA